MVRKYNVHFCSFCRKVPEEIESAFIQGPEGVNLCEKCVDLCANIVKEHRDKANTATDTTTSQDGPKPKPPG